MRKVFFCNTLMEGCHYVRALIPMREGGWDGDKTSLRAEKMDNDTRARAVLDADIVVFHRPNDDRAIQISDILKKQGKKIVMENDDTYKGFNLSKLGKLADKFGEVERNLDKFAQQADLITCSTEFLANEYRKLNPNVVVLPNCVDPEDWPDEDEIERNEGDTIRIGILGSVGLHSDISGFTDVLEQLGKRKEVKLVLFSLPDDKPGSERVHEYYKPELHFWQGYNVEWHPFVKIADYREKLNSLKLDLVVIPRNDDYFNRCKSNLKFLESSMLEIPVIAQGFETGDSPYQDPEDAKYMEIVINNDTWMEVIEPYLDSKEKRREMGREARKYVLSRYDIKDNIDKWHNAYDNLYAKEEK